MGVTMRNQTYQNIISIRLDPVTSEAIRKLAESWQVYDKDDRINRSETIRRAIIYSYLVYVKGIDPVRASADLEQYMFDELLKLGLSNMKSKGKKKIINIWE
jgi:hypothetical protein